MANSGNGEQTSKQASSLALLAQYVIFILLPSHQSTYYNGIKQ